MPNPLRMRFGESVPPSQSGFKISYRGQVIDVGLPASYRLEQAVAPSMAKIASHISSHPGNPNLAAAQTTLRIVVSVSGAAAKTSTLTAATLSSASQSKKDDP